MPLTPRVWPWLFAIVAGAGAARADTIPCDHRHVASKVREFFDHVQADRKTGFKAGALEGAREVGQEKLPENVALRRFCEANLKVEGGETIVVYVTVTSREGYKKDRAEDVQTCWENKKYGEPAVIGASSGCGPLKAGKR